MFILSIFTNNYMNIQLSAGHPSIYGDTILGLYITNTRASLPFDCLIKFAITMLYVCFAIYDEFKFISLLYAEWANRTLIWLLENLHSMFIFPKTTAKPIRIICIYIQQSTMSLLSFDQYSLRQPVFFFLHIIAWIVACPKILDSLHIYVINHVVTYNNITDVVGTSGQSTVTWGVRASAWKTRVLPVFKCQLNEEIGQWLIIFNCGNLTLRCK